MHSWLRGSPYGGYQVIPLAAALRIHRIAYAGYAWTGTTGRVMGILGDTLFIPISVTAFVTGTLLGLFTSWGLFQHRWVAVKFWLTLIAVVLTPLSLLPGIHDAAVTVSHTPADQIADVDASGAISAACVSLTMYTTSVVLSIFKPWGRTTLERKNIAGEPTAVAAVRAGVKSG